MTKMTIFLPYNLTGAFETYLKKYPTDHSGFSVYRRVCGDDQSNGTNRFHLAPFLHPESGTE